MICFIIRRAKVQKLYGKKLLELLFNPLLNDFSYQICMSCVTNCKVTPFFLLFSSIFRKSMI